MSDSTEPVIGQPQTETLKNDSVKHGNVKGKNGGARPGAGRKPGGMNKTTKERMAIKQRVIDRIHHNADTLLNAAMNKAVGETYLMRKVTERDSKGKVLRVYHETVTSPQTIIDYLDGELEDGDSINNDDGDSYYYMTTKPVDVSAVRDLFDRAFGKPDSKVENIGEQKLIIETRRHKG